MFTDTIRMLIKTGAMMKCKICIKFDIFGCWKKVKTDNKKEEEWTRFVGQIWSRRSIRLETREIVSFWCVYWYLTALSKHRFWHAFYVKFHFNDSVNWHNERETRTKRQLVRYRMNHPTNECTPRCWINYRVCLLQAWNLLCYSTL